MYVFRVSLDLNPYKPSVFFVGRRQTAQSQIRRRITLNRGVSSVFPLFAYRMFYKNLNENEKYHPTPLKLVMDCSN